MLGVHNLINLFEGEAMKKFIALSLVLALMFALVGCSTGESTSGTEATEIETVPATTAVPVDYLDVYGEVLDNFYDLITSKDDSAPTEAGQTGVREAIAGLDKEASLGVVGYTFMDLTGDGFSELVVGAVSSSEDSWFDKPELFAVYTIAHDMPWLLFEGFAKSSYYLLDDGTFLYEGSGGAAYSMVGNYRMSQGGTSLICNDYYFTSPGDEDESVTEIYHNTSGKTDKEKSEKLDITADELSKIRTDLEAKIAPIDFTPFFQYK